MIGRPRVYNEERVATSFRIPRALHARLIEAAADRDLSANYLATRALEEFLDRLIPAEDLRLTTPLKDPE